MNKHKPREQKPKERERAEERDRMKSSDPFLQAVASAKETLEDRDTKI